MFFEAIFQPHFEAVTNPNIINPLLYRQNFKKKILEPGDRVLGKIPPPPPPFTQTLLKKRST
jgi:hypothetical protein